MNRIRTMAVATAGGLLLLVAGAGLAQEPQEDTEFEDVFTGIEDDPTLPDTSDRGIDPAVRAELDRLYPTGERTNCILMPRSGASIRAVTESRVLIRLSASRYFISDMSQKCRGAADRRNILVHRDPARNLCKGDRVDVVDGRMRGARSPVLRGWCQFGDFQYMAVSDTPKAPSKPAPVDTDPDEPPPR
jgi:hypothetical protein